MTAEEKLRYCADFFRIDVKEKTKKKPLGSNFIGKVMAEQQKEEEEEMVL